MNGVEIPGVGIQTWQGMGNSSAVHSQNVVGKVPEPHSSEFSEVLAEVRPDGVEGVGDHEAVAEGEPETSVIDWSTGMSQLVDNLGQSEARIDRLIRRGMRGRTFSQSELLSMQALVYRYSQQLGVTSKLTEAVTAGARQMLTIQI